MADHNSSAVGDGVDTWYPYSATTTLSKPLNKAEVVLAMLLRDISSREVLITRHDDADAVEIDLSFDIDDSILVEIGDDLSFDQIVDQLYEILGTCRGRQLR